MPEEPVKTAYELLHVHPAAPGELLNASYWSQVGDLQQQREGGENVDSRLHELTVAYQRISDPESRTAYDAALGLTTEDIASGPIPRRKKPRALRFLPSGQSSALDHYTVLGLSPGISPRVVDEAYRIMRDRYMRLPKAKGRREAFLGLLDEAYENLRDSHRRSLYDASQMQQPPATNGQFLKSEPEVTMARAAGRTSTPERAEVKVKSTSVTTPPNEKRQKVKPVPTASTGTSASTEGASQNTNAPAKAARWLGSLRPRKGTTKTGPVATTESVTPPKAAAKTIARSSQKDPPVVTAGKVASPKAKQRAAVDGAAKAASAKAIPPPVSKKLPPQRRPKHTLDKAEVEGALLGRLAVSMTDYLRKSDGAPRPETTPPPGS